MRDADILEGMLRHVPTMHLEFCGDCAQANGLDLPVVVINLPHRIDRWQAVSRRMSAAGLTKLIKAPAVEGRRLSDDQIAALLARPVNDIDEAPRSHLTLTRPAIGCFLSHLAIWQWMLETNLPELLVFEDDAAPAAQYDPARFRRVVTSLSQKTGLVFLGCMIMGGLADRTQGSELARLYYFNGTFAYLITHRACQSLLRHLLPLRAHIDHQISNILIDQRHILPAHYAAPALFEPDWSLRSDCYVPLADYSVADGEFNQIIEAHRRALLNEQRPLLPLTAGAPELESV